MSIRPIGLVFVPVALKDIDLQALCKGLNVPSCQCKLAFAARSKVKVIRL